MQSEINLAGDHVRRFIFEHRPVRGHWVHLEYAWRELRAHTSYPAPVNALLGEAVAAAVLLAATLKFKGTLTFQLQGNGGVSLLVAQCTHDFRLRAVARWDADALNALATCAPRGLPFRELVGSDGRITVTVEADERSQRYQGVVPLAGDSLAQSLEAYFASSEQLPARLILAADDTRAAGMLVQKLPGDGTGPDEESLAAWEEAVRGIERVRAPQLLGRPVEEVLARTFADQDLRLFRGSPVRFECRCSLDRVTGVLKALGAGEVRDVLKEQGSVTVTCEFCQRPYQFDAIDIEALFADTPGAGGSPARH